MKFGWTLLLAIFLFFNFSGLTLAREEVLGIHILSPGEINNAGDLLNKAESDSWHYVTIPFSVADLEKKAEWQDFMAEAKNKKIIPIVRLVTKFENGAWQIPSRKSLVEQINFLNQLSWPTEKKHLIIYNEVNHEAEWGGKIDPIGYARVLKFAYLWAKSEDNNFIILPAALDLAASNSQKTKESFAYLQAMLDYDGEILNYLDVWNSHSYPNPAFSASVYRNGKNSLRGFAYELDFIKNKTGRDLPTFITETGWVENIYTRHNLNFYYQYALKNIWSDKRVVAVTPFILQGAPGPFTQFSFLDANNQPTGQYLAFKRAVEGVN